MNLPIDFSERVDRLRASSWPPSLETLSAEAIRDQIRRGHDTQEGFAALRRINAARHIASAITDGAA